MNRFIMGLLVGLVVLVFGLLWFYDGFEKKPGREYSEKKADVVSVAEEINVRVLKSEKEVIFFATLPGWSNDERLHKQIVERVNDAAEKWQKENPKTRIASILIEEKDVPRMYSISLLFQAPIGPVDL
ncbi:MAG: hypothetical protein EXS52_02540 [Candidatus Staskawiczbacteria bacterium]|nr:hypothetical protein [Candidatus Staskawiczbacteria bacterium]